MSDKTITSLASSAACSSPCPPNSGLRTSAGVPEDCEWVDIDGERIAYVDQGKGPALVCLHAIGHGGRDFEALAEALCADHRVLRIDWPGHGRSGRALRAPDAQRYAVLVSHVLRKAGLERPVLIGNSIGGAAALTYAQQHPVRALVLCNSAGLLPIDRRTRRGCVWMARFFGAGERRAWWFPSLYRAYYRWLVLPGTAARMQRRRISAAGPELASLLRQAWQGFAQPHADLRQLAASMKAPVWYAWARKDRLNTLRANLPAMRATPGMQLTTYEAGHSAFLEQPQAFVRDLRAFLRLHP